MTLYGYARVSVREPEDKNLDLQVERLVRAGTLSVPNGSWCWPWKSRIALRMLLQLW